MGLKSRIDGRRRDLTIAMIDLVRRALPILNWLVIHRIVDMKAVVHQAERVRMRPAPLAVSNGTTRVQLLGTARTARRDRWETISGRIPCPCKWTPGCLEEIKNEAGSVGWTFDVNSFCHTRFAIPRHRDNRKSCCSHHRWHGAISAALRRT